MDEIPKLIRIHALRNAILHNGSASEKSVLANLLAENAALRPKAREIIPQAAKIVAEINSLSLDEQKKELDSLGIVIEKKVEAERKLPPLPNADKYKKIRMRFAPAPSGPLHIGHVRALVLNGEYCKLYNGELVIRLEDTNPENIMLDAYGLIPADIKWVGYGPKEFYIQSDRIPIYYEYCEEMLERGFGYVCTCRSEDFRGLIEKKKSCPCRDLPPHEHMSRWEKMLNKETGFKEGDAVVRVKTDLLHDNPAVRDWPALRIIDTPHPRTKDAYRVYPLYNFSVSIDDHLMGITHVLRGKDHLVNTVRQSYLFKHFGWDFPETIHYGKLNIANISEGKARKTFSGTLVYGTDTTNISEEETVGLSKTKLKKAILDGLYTGWDDPRLATLLALKRRGIAPEAIREMMFDMGCKQADATLSWENLYAYNKKVVDPIASRYFFVLNPTAVSIQPEVTEAEVELHPTDKSRGTRKIPVSKTIFVSDMDFKQYQGKEVRLLHLLNIILEKTAMPAPKDVKDFQKLQWVSEPNVQVKIFMPDGSTVSGLGEPALGELAPDTIVQLVRFGFCRVDSVGKEVVLYFTHE